MKFTDTVYFLALLNPRDQFHELALQISRTLKDTIVTTAWILMEIGNGLAQTINRVWFPDFVRELQAAADVEIVPATMVWFERGLRLYESRPDKDWSLTDCISFAVMQERGIHEAITSDHHFEQAGFHVLMKM